MSIITMFLSSLVLSLSSSFAFAQSFEGVTEFQSLELRGTLSLTCFGTGQTENRYFQCARETLEPMEVGYFNVETTSAADKVKLTATWPDGKVRSQELDFDATTGRSKKRANLWIETVFQRSLLDIGANQITYELLANGEVVQSGSFVAQVNRVEGRSCQHASDISHNLDDCKFSSFACSRYFHRQNYCRAE